MMSNPVGCDHDCALVDELDAAMRYAGAWLPVRLVGSPSDSAAVPLPPGFVTAADSQP